MELPISDTLIIALSKLVDDALPPGSREPSHYDLGAQIIKAGLSEVDPKAQGQSIGKAKRIRAILNWALDNNPSAGGRLIALTISLVRGVGGFRETSPNFVGRDQVINLIQAFDAEHYLMTEAGEVQPKILSSLSGKNLTKALLAYAVRAKKGSEDAALLSGTGKDLLEATAKHIIKTKYGTDSQNQSFPVLLSTAYSALGMAISQAPKISGEPAIKAYERAIFEIALSINLVRNKEGTGHGRLCISSLSEIEARSIIESVGVVAEFLLNRLDS